MLRRAGTNYFALRDRLTRERNEGLTSLYNAFHRPEEWDPEIVALREAHAELDRLVVIAYGWDDLAGDLGHDFHETRQGERYTIHPAMQEQLHDRLLALNHQRHAEEVAAGLVDENGKPLKKKGGGKKPAKGSARQANLGIG